MLDLDEHGYQTASGRGPGLLVHRQLQSRSPKGREIKLKFLAVSISSCPRELQTSNERFRRDLSLKSIFFIKEITMIKTFADI